MIFADAIPEVGQFALAMAAITSLGAFGTAVLAYLATRDKLRYDAEIVKLRAEVAALTVRTKECHDEREEMRTEREEARAERDAMRAEVVELRRLVSGRSGPHTSLPPTPPREDAR